MESNNGLGKLLPKAMVKRRRKNKDEDERGRRTLSREPTLESDDTNSTHMADEEDMDDGSFGSYESGGADADAADQDSERSRSRPPPARPTTISSHPSQVGYLTTSSPVVQATHLDSQPGLRSPLRSERKRGTSSKNSSPNASRERLDETAAILEPPAVAKTASPGKRAKGPPPRIATFPPRTPPTEDHFAPVIVNTPPTPVERTTSITSSEPERRLSRTASGPVSNGDGTFPSRTMSGHRRTRSGSASIGPSKLSNITAAPLSPTPENGEATPSSAGFFSSMFSAAQNAASTISSNIQGTGIAIGANKNRTNSFKSQISPAPSQVDFEPPPPEPPAMEDTVDKKESAVRTLGAGELSLSQLGIPDPATSLASSESTKFPDVGDTRARAESAPTDTQTRSGEFVPEESASRPRSLYEAAGGEQEQTASQPDHVDGKVEMHRSASTRSDSKSQRKRAGSVATAVTVGAVIPASNTVQPGGTAVAAPKLTGFAIASKKRNRDFHSFFKSVPDDDYLIEDYSCALQREILAHGRLYVSEGHLCFSSNILGWTTTLVMSFDEIVSVEKRSTALVFKNGLMISTLHAKHIFASFTSRDATYDLIVNIWKLGHPTLKSTLNGVQLEGTGGDKTEKIDAEPSTLEPVTPAGSDSEEESDEEEDFYDEEESEHTSESQTVDTNGVDADGDRANVGTTAPNGTQLDAANDAQSSPAGFGSFPGPATHPPTDCGDSATHYEKHLADEVIAAPLGKVFSLVFGEASPSWMGQWITENQKCFELQMEDKKGLSLENRSRNLSYIKPLNAPIGPRQTKCLVTEAVDLLDFEKAVNLSVTTQTPDVPSGNIFRVKTKCCLSWAENNGTRMQVSCTTEWSGKSWLRGPIEKNVNEGQAQYFKDLVASLRAAVSSRPRAATGGNGAPKTKKKGKKGKALQSSVDTADASVGSKNAADKNWGMLEPVRGLAEPIIDIIQPVLTGNIMYGLLVGLLVATWFGFGFTPSKNTSALGPDLAISNSYRLAAYEEMWRREDSELWGWLEERVGLERLAADSSNARKKVVEPRAFEEKLREERMDGREVEEAIRVTEEKLRVLREVIARTSQSEKGGRRETP